MSDDVTLAVLIRLPWFPWPREFVRIFVWRFDPYWITAVGALGYAITILLALLHWRDWKL